MKNKLLVLNLFLGVLAVGCSESAYTPTATVPAYNNGLPAYTPGATNPNYNNQYQPGMNNPMMNPLLNQQGLAYQQQAVMGWNARVNFGIPGYSYQTYQTRSCIPQKTYTTTSTQQTVRPACPNPTTVVTSSSTVVTTNTTAGDDTTKVLPISWVNEDAKALYQRLAREEETSKTNKNAKYRTGENYQCVVDGKASKAKNYVCDLYIRVKDGILLQQSPIGKEGQPENTTSSMYKGDLLNIGIPGETPETGYLIVAGKSAAYLFQKLPGDAVTGKVEEAGILEAKVKTVGQVKCYQSLNTTNTTTECVIKLDTSKGKALSF